MNSRKEENCVSTFQTFFAEYEEPTFYISTRVIQIVLRRLNWDRLFQRAQTYLQLVSLHPSTARKLLSI